MASYILKRVALLVPTLLAVVILVFLIMHSIPGDPAANLLGVGATKSDLSALRHAMGLDRPLPSQFVTYMSRLARGNLGVSFYYQRPVVGMIAQRLPATLQLTLAALVIAVMFAIPLGVVAAVRRNTVVDEVSRVISLAGVSIPVFWLAMLLMYIFALELRWFPLTGSGGPFWTLSGLHHIILPAASLGATMMGSTARLMRASMLEELKKDYVRSASAKGLPRRLVIYKHALRNALIPVVTNIGLQMGVLLGGAFLTETIFAWPGVGRLAVNAILRRDFPVVQGVTLVIAILFVVVNFLVDMSYALLDPRIEYA